MITAYLLCARELGQNDALAFDVDACLIYSPFGFVHLTHQILGTHALFCHNSLAKSKWVVINLKGVLHSWPILWLFMHVSQKLQHIGDK